MRDNVKGITYKELSELVNKRFGTSISDATAKTTCFRKGLSNKIDGRFKKGSEPYNKVCVGTVVERNGYKIVKVQNNGNKYDWKYMHILLWEFFNGEVGEGEAITFLDGDRKNLSPDNLIKVNVKTSRSYNLNKLRSNNKEMNEILLKVLEIDRLTRVKVAE